MKISHDSVCPFLLFLHTIIILIILSKHKVIIENTSDALINVVFEFA